LTPTILPGPKIFLVFSAKYSKVNIVNYIPKIVKYERQDVSFGIYRWSLGPDMERSVVFNDFNSHRHSLMLS
jgi:hypothetical protein